MGPVVLNPVVAVPSSPSDPSLRLYAQCLPGKPGGVAIAALNTGRHGAHTFSLSRAADRYTLTAPNLTSTTVLLNGSTLHTGPDGSLPLLDPEHLSPGTVTLEPLSVTFLSVPTAQNASCR
jgi:hypothetical protein